MEHVVTEFIDSIADLWFADRPRAPPQCWPGLMKKALDKDYKANLY